jgi:hypothetical protein
MEFTKQSLQFQLKKVIFTIIFCVHFGAHSQGVFDSEISLEICQLTNDSLRQNYLEGIHDKDQYYRNYRKELMDSLNPNSIEVSCASLDMMLNDVLNFKRIICFVDQFGYPSSEIYGDYASDAAWLVLHHNYGMPYRYLGYSILKNAWVSNKINSDKFDFYLRALLKNYIKADEELSLQKLVEMADFHINQK